MAKSEDLNSYAYRAYNKNIRVTKRSFVRIAAPGGYFMH